MIISGIIFLTIATLYLFPRVFGFRKYEGVKDLGVSAKKLPFWFWIGLIVWGIALYAFAAELSEPKLLTNFAFLPLCWGFILMLDGLVYFVADGNSLINNNRWELVIMAVASVSGWLIFEYLNCFIQFNWFYEHAGILSKPQFNWYAILGSSAFIPMSFEWFQLLKKVKVLNYKYKNGPKIIFSKIVKVIILILSFAVLFITPRHPDDLFFAIWVLPVVIIAIVLGLLNIETPFTKIKTDGDWTFILTFALTFLVQGILLEAWNFSSGHYVEKQHFSNNPAYWQYCIPFADVFRIFEMPFFGYMGYLFFSIHNWLWAKTLAEILGKPLDYSLGEEYV